MIKYVLRNLFEALEMKCKYCRWLVYKIAFRCLNAFFLHAIADLSKLRQLDRDKLYGNDAKV